MHLKLLDNYSNLCVYFQWTFWPSTQTELFDFNFLSPQGRCIDGVNKFTCICDPGYVGRICDTDYDDCSSSPCAHGECVKYKTPHFQSLYCKDIVKVQQHYV